LAIVPRKSYALGINPAGQIKKGICVNVPAHLIFGAAAFGKPGQPRVTTAAVLGSFVPDISLFVMAGWSLFVAGIDPSVVFGQYYFSDRWQQVFAVDNSFVLWGAGLGMAIWARRPVLVAFIAAVLLHLAFDFALHNDDARIQFWPISDWKFYSPLSYWDPRYYANIVSPVETVLTLILAGVLYMRFRRLGARVLIILAGAAQLLTGGVFGMLFTH